MPQRKHGLRTPQPHQHRQVPSARLFIHLHQRRGSGASPWPHPLAAGFSLRMERHPLFPDDFLKIHQPANSGHASKHVQKAHRDDVYYTGV